MPNTSFIIAITTSELSPTAQLGDMALIAETKISAYFESYPAPMSLLNALITAIALREKDKAIPMLKRLEKEFEIFDIFIKEWGKFQPGSIVKNFGIHISR